MTCYHVMGLYDTNIGIVYPNNSEQFDNVYSRGAQSTH